MNPESSEEIARSEYEKFWSESYGQENSENPIRKFIKVTHFWSRANGRHHKGKRKPRPNGRHILLVVWRGKTHDFTRIRELGISQLDRLDEIACIAYEGFGYDHELGQNQKIDWRERAIEDIKKLFP